MSSQGSFTYQKPPVVEVVCGVKFDVLQKLITPHLGFIWDLYKEQGYIKCEEHPPLAGNIEPLYKVPSPQITLHAETTPSFPRIWFLHETSEKIIQIQRDRFIFNWRTLEQESQYPGLDSIVDGFEKHFSRFENFVTEECEPIKRLQYELTYIDHVPRGEGWESIGGLGSLLNRFIAKGEEGHFLDGAEGVIWRTWFQLPIDARLYVTIRNRTLQPEKEVLQVEFTTRGPLTPPSPSIKENATILLPSQEWFKLVRQQVRQKFTNLFSEEVQTQKWGKTDVSNSS